MDAPAGAQRRRPSRGALVAALAAFVVLGAAVAFFALRGSGSSTTSTGPTSTAAATTPTSPTVGTTTTTTSSTTTPQATTTTVFTPTATTTAVWPDPNSGLRYGDPAEAARGFAVDFVGFVDPVVGAYMAGDARSGEVEVRPKAGGMVTVVFVRQLDTSDTWWVLGSATPNIRLDHPSALDEVTSPIELSGVSTAFEAMVNVEVREDGSREPIVTTTVMGGSMGEMGPFNSSVEYTAHRALGALVLSTRSMETGDVQEASVVRIRFAP